MPNPTLTPATPLAPSIRGTGAGRPQGQGAGEKEGWRGHTESMQSSKDKTRPTFLRVTD